MQQQLVLGRLGSYSLCDWGQIDGGVHIYIVSHGEAVSVKFITGNTTHRAELLCHSALSQCSSLVRGNVTSD